VGNGSHPREQIVQSSPIACTGQCGEIAELDPIMGVRHLDLGHLAPLVSTGQPAR
jgi:hypothetical protein